MTPQGCSGSSPKVPPSTAGPVPCAPTLKAPEFTEAWVRDVGGVGRATSSGPALPWHWGLQKEEELEEGEEERKKALDERLRFEQERMEQERQEQEERERHIGSESSRLRNTGVTPAPPHPHLHGPHASASPKGSPATFIPGGNNRL